jgi:hypothetical protein
MSAAGTPRRVPAGPREFANGRSETSHAKKPAMNDRGEQRHVDLRLELTGQCSNDLGWEADDARADVPGARRKTARARERRSGIVHDPAGMDSAAEA